MDILNITEKYQVDVSIGSSEYYAFNPISGTQLNNAGEITIRIDNQDAFFYPKKSWLQIDGKLVKNVAQNTAYDDADLVTLVNNGIMHCFSNIKYQLGGQEIESLYHVGQATTLLGLLRYNTGFEEGGGLNQCWYPDEVNGTAAATNLGFAKRHAFIITKPNPKGTFRFAINLHHILAFFEDYEKVITGMTQTLTLVRTSDDNNAIFRADAADAGKVVIDRITWVMPKIEPNDEERFKLYKTIESKAVIDVFFRMRQCTNVQIATAVPSFTWRLGVRSAPERPRYVIVGLQTNRVNSQTANIGIFDNNNVKNMYVMLNERRYPTIDYNANFTTLQIGNFYKEFADFSHKYYGIDRLISTTGIDPISYKEMHPIFVFDVSRQIERVKQSVVDITVEMMFNGNCTANTVAYALIISDRMLKFQSDGKKMTVMY